MNDEIREQEEHLDSINGDTGSNDAQTEEVRKSKAGLYVVLAQNEENDDWAEVGVYEIKNGDPKRQAMEDKEQSNLHERADEPEGVRLKAVPLTSWTNERSYRYDRVLREID
jgi:cobalamin biosynthesis protein CobT